MQNGFWESEDGQDFVEYTLLMAFVVVLTGAVLLLSPQSIAACVTRVQTHLNRATLMGG